MECPKCRHPNPAEARFCMACGTKLEPVCAQCGAKLPPEAKFCVACGAKVSEQAPVTPAVVPPRLEDVQHRLYIPEPLRQRMHAAGKEIEGETRLVTVMFADISGFTPASEELSPEEVADLVNQCFKEIVDIICRYEGSVNRFIGDCALVFFGAPIAHEDDPERAILAALDVRAAVTRLNRRISVGINTGMMYIGPIGTDLHHEYTAEGHHINVAKRLQESAGAGQIVVGEATYKFAQRAFAFERLPPLSLKGIRRPVQAYAVLRPLGHPEKLRGIEGLRAQLIGREREFASLTDCARALVTERKGQIVTIVGEAGIGKSRLVAELKAHLKDQDVRWLEGRCLSIGQSVGFWPFIDVMKTHLGISSEDSEQDLAGKLVQHLTALFGQEAEGIIPYVGQMLSMKLNERYRQRIRYAAPEQVRRQTLLRMRDLFVALARRQPLILVLEDLHWADDLSLDLLYVLMDELVAAPMLLLCVYRPERAHRSWQIDGVASSKHLERYTPIALKPLTPRQSQEMVESLLAVDNLPVEIKAAILEKTEGNPFFVEEVIRLLIEQGAIFQEEGRWRAKEAIKELTVPDTIQSVILSRIDRLHGEVKHVLQCASVIGRVFQHRLLSYLAGREEAMEDYLAELEAGELVYKEKIVPELEYAFKHALTQETTYQGLLSRRRRAFHERVGQGIEALYQEQVEEYVEQLAYHYSHSDNREKAIEYLIKAGQKAATRYANREALDYFQGALDVIEAGEEYDRVLGYRAKLLLGMFRGEEAAKDYERLLVSARGSGDRKQELASLLGLASASFIMALDDPEHASTSLTLYRQAYALARELDDKASMVRSLAPTGELCSFWLDYWGEAAANAEEALALSQELGDEDLIIDSLMARLWFLKPVEAEEQAEDLLRRLEARHDLLRLKEHYFFLVWFHALRGDFERCVECCDASIHLSAGVGAPPVMYPTLKALAFLHLGCYDAAWASLQKEVVDEAHPFGRAVKEFGMGHYFLELMAYEKTFDMFESVIDQARRLRRPFLRYEAQIRLAQSLIRSGQLDRVNRESITQALASIGTASLTQVLPAEAVGEIDLSEGKLDEALRQAVSACAQAEESGRRLNLVSAMELQMRVLLQLDRPGEVVALADAALRTAEEMNYQPMVWRLRAAKAQALTMLGHTEAAAQEYQAAAATIRKLAETIGDADLKRGFLSDPLVSSILAASNQHTRQEGEAL